MEEKILVTYATKYGSTAEIAETLGEYLREEGKDTDVAAISDTFDITPYSAIIIGGPLYMGKWLPEIVNFVKKHQNQLHECPVLVFVVGYTLMDISEDRRKKALGAVDVISPYVNIHEVGLFAGKVPHPSEGLSFREKASMKMEGIEPGDYRNKEAIRAWAKGLVDLRLLHL